MKKITSMEVLGQMVATSATVMLGECHVPSLAVIAPSQALTEAAALSAMIKELAFIKTFPD